MVYFWDYLISYFVYSNTGKYLLSFIFLYLFFFIALSVAGVFDNGKTLKRVKAVLSLAMATIALYNPYTQEIIFSIITNMTSILLLFFGLITVLYMAGKVIIHSKMKDDFEYNNTLRKVQKYALYIFVGLAILGGLYIITTTPLPYGIVPPAIMDYVGTMIPKVILLGIIGGLLYYLIIRPIRKETEEDAQKKKLDKVKDILIKAKEAEQEAENKQIAKLAEQLGVDWESAYAIHQMLKKEREKH